MDTYNTQRNMPTVITAEFILGFLSFSIYLMIKTVFLDFRGQLKIECGCKNTHKIYKE